jgi:cardiolipin synthase
MSFLLNLLQSVNSIWTGLIPVVFLIYLVGSTIFIVMENKEPKTTLAWILLFWLLPFIGPLVYAFFGRGHRAFSREGKLLKQIITSETQPNLRGLVAQQEQCFVGEVCLSLSQRRVAEMCNRNSYSLLTLHNHVQILQNASKKYPLLLEDMRKAKHAIHIQYYSWESDKFTEQIKDILIEKARAGVQVRALYDWAGCLGGLHHDYVKALKDNGVKILPYLKLGINQVHNIGYRNHRKIVVVDGDVGYVGGINMGEEYLTGGKYFPAWRDTHLRVQGEGAAALQVAFAVGWFNTTGELLDDPAFYTHSRPERLVPMQIVSSGPDSEWAAVRQLYFKLITNAEKRVFIQSPFFILDDAISEAIKAACLSGVDVRIMLTPRGGVYQVPYRAALTFCAEMSRAGAKIYFYQAGYLHA